MGTLAGRAGDCERLVDGVLNQPVNAISSLAFVIAGVAVFVRTRQSRSTGEPEWLVSGALILMGFSSAAFHGFGGRLAVWVHDASLAGLLALLVTIEVFRRTRMGWSATSWWVAWAGIATIAWYFPASTSTVTAAAAVAAFLLVLAPARWSRPDSSARVDTDRLRSLLLPICLVAAGFTVFQLSRTDGPLCDPDSLLQGHAVWHLLAGTGLALYGARIGLPANGSVGPGTPPPTDRRENM